MPLNKFAAWGVALIDRPRPPGLTAELRRGLAALNATLAKALPAPAPVVKVPSATALRIVWSLNALRDALSDQGEPNVVDCNEQLKDRFESQAVGEVIAYLEDQHPELLDHYRGQFRPLVADADAAEAFDLERRERLAELATFELLVMATVGDVPASPAPPAGPSVRSRSQRRAVAPQRR